MIMGTGLLKDLEAEILVRWGVTGLGTFPQHMHE